MDFLSKHVKQISFRQCVFILPTLGQLQGWQPHFQPTDAKSSISTVLHWFAAVTYRSTTEGTITAFVTNLGDH